MCKNCKLYETGNICELSKRLDATRTCSQTAVRVGPRFISIDTRSFPAGRLRQRDEIYIRIRTDNIKTEMWNAKRATVRRVIQ